MKIIAIVGNTIFFFFFVCIFINIWYRAVRKYISKDINKMPVVRISNRQIIILIVLFINTIFINILVDILN